MTYILCKDTSKNTARKSSSKPTPTYVCLSDEYAMELGGCPSVVEICVSKWTT